MKSTLLPTAGACLPTAGRTVMAPTVAPHQGTGVPTARLRIVDAALLATVPAADGFAAVVGSCPPRGAPV
jgi:hypothetical protein